MKYISKLFWFNNIFERAQHFVIYFHKAEKQLAFLWEEQKTEYNRKKFALTFSVITQ